MKANERDDLLQALKARFVQNPQRHEGLVWDQVVAKIEAKAQSLQALAGMEATGGEPDVIGYDPETGCYVFCDCSAESPTGRRSLCYDQRALNSRKENKPKSSAVEDGCSARRRVAH